MINYIKEYFKPLKVMKKGKVKNSHGDWVEQYVDSFEGSGYIRLLNGSEQRLANRSTYISTHRLYIVISDIKKGDRVIQNGQTFNVIMPNSIIDNVMQVDLEVVE